jgi:hypothetical protein
MNTFEVDTSIYAPPVQADDAEPFLEVQGSGGSVLRATRAHLTICPGIDAFGTGEGQRRWSYAQLGEVRLDAYGPVGVIRATIRSTGGNLPLLLLEPDQIAAARRTLEIIWNLMAVAQDAGRPS